MWGVYYFLWDTVYTLFIPFCTFYLMLGVTPNSQRFDASIGGALFDSQPHSRIFMGCYDHAISAIWGVLKCLISQRTTGFLQIS